jgi:hypothetical protein
LLDYAVWEKDVSVKRIFAVLPYTPVSDLIKSFILKLKKTVALEFEVLFYNKQENSFKRFDEFL